jgi:hypothetical protein
MTESDSIPLVDFQPQIAELILDTPAPGKHAARHALRHLERAWRIRAVDPEMAVFRAITAEEEAARALFHSLQRRRYPGAERLNWRKHEHKSAVAPFFEVVRHFLANIPQVMEIKLVIDRRETPVRLQIALQFPFLKEWVFPIPPLNYNISANDKLHDFGPEIEKLAQDKNVARLQDHIVERANQRNRLLYASDQGLPNVDGDVDKVILGYRNIVFQILAVYVMVDPYSEHQNFVEQTLDAFLRIVPRLRPVQ